MDADYRSYAAIGIRVDPKLLKTKETVRQCKCTPVGKTTTPFKFCPNCGVQFLETVEFWRKECLPPDDLPETFCGFPLVFCTDGKGVVIGPYRCETKWSGGGADGELAFVALEGAEVFEAKEALKSKLEPLGLWDEKKFGLWAVQYYSY